MLDLSCEHPLQKLVSWERDQRKPEVIQLPLLGLDGDHTDADAALACSSDGRRERGSRSYRTPSHSARSADCGSSTTSDVASKRMVALRESSYFGQPGSPLVGLWGYSQIMAAAPQLSGYGYLGSMGVMMPSLSSSAAAMAPMAPVAMPR